MTSNTSYFDVFIHSIRLSIAVCIAALIGLALEAGHTYWLMFTVVFVLQSELGPSIKKSIQRIIGTIIGAIIGLIIIKLVGETEHIKLLILGVVIFFLAILTLQKFYGVCVVFITILVLLSLDLFGVKSIVETAEDRVIDTILGTIIAVTVAMGVWPKSFNQSLIKEFGAFLETSGVIYEQIMSQNLTPQNSANFKKDFLNYLKQARALVQNAEKAGWEIEFTKSVKVDKALREKIISHTVVLTKSVLETNTLIQKARQNDGAIKKASINCGVEIKNLLLELGQNVKNFSKITIDKQELIAKLQNNIQIARNEILQNTPSDDDKWRELVRLSVFKDQMADILNITKEVSLDAKYA